MLGLTVSYAKYLVLLNASISASVRFFESLGQVCSLVLKLFFIFVICV